MSRLILVVATLAVASACEYDDACDRLADYVCTCHTDEDCTAYEDLAIAPSSDVLDQCVIELAERRSDDEDAGVGCDAT